jgi:hypothetical protein
MGEPPMQAETTHVPDVQPKARIFVSYSRKDMAFADRLDFLSMEPTNVTITGK